MAQAQTVDRPPRLPLATTPSNRDDVATKDARLVNCYVERGENEGEFHVYKRPGLLTDITKTGNGYGVYNWLNDIYAAFGTSLFKNGTSIGTIDATGGVYRFSATLGATPRLVLGNGVKAYTYDGTTFAQITDVDFPSAFVKGWAYLDQTTYVATAAAHIQGSGLNDPTAWDPLNFLIAQIEPDNAVALAKQLVYVIILKQWSTEVFYDAANATGSPLGTVQGAKINYGCLSQDSVQDIDGDLIWACTNRSAAPQVIMLSNLKAEIVSTKPVERLLDEADWTAVFSWQLKDEGHKFYILTLKNTNITLVYDLTEKMWHQWTDSNGNYVPIVASTYNSTLQHIVQHETNGKLYFMDRSYTNDDGTAIQVDIYTPIFDGGTRRIKNLNLMTFVGDQQPGSILQVRKSDDDYQTWSNFRQVDLSKKKPILTSNGSFTKRAYNFRHSSDTKMRLQAVELQLDLGVL